MLGGGSALSTVDRALSTNMSLNCCRHLAEVPTMTGHTSRSAVRVEARAPPQSGSSLLRAVLRGSAHDTMPVHFDHTIVAGHTFIERCVICQPVGIKWPYDVMLKFC